MKYELRNISSTPKTVELNHLPVDEHGGGDNMFSEGAVFKDKQWIGQCLAPAPELPDTLYMPFFPYWDDSYAPHYFDIEINGQLFDMSEVQTLTETQNFPENLKHISDYIKLYHTDNGWARLFIRNVTDQLLHVKFIKRNDWRGSQSFDDVERATLKLTDDRRNPSIRYHEDESFEFDLVPYVPYDQVPEKDKMILELDIENQDDWLESIYLDVINREDLHKDDYIFIDWGDGTVAHIKFSEQVEDRYADISQIYALWEFEPPAPGRRTIKIHTSHPLQYLYCMNVAKIIQWGSYVAEEIYGMGVRYGTGTVLEAIPDESFPAWLTWIDLEEESKPGMMLNVKHIDNLYTMVNLTDTSDNRRWNGYGRVDKFINYNDYTGKINGDDITWGEYPDEYPFTGFDVNDIDQLGIILTAGPGQGVGLSAQLDFNKKDPGNLIGTARPNNTSAFVEWKTIPDKEQIHFLINMNDYFDGGFAKEDFLCYIRAFFTGSAVSGRIHAQFFGWKNASINLGDDGLGQFTQTALYETEGNLQSEVVSDNPLTAGTRAGVIHYDPYLNLIIPKPMNMVLDESVTWKQDNDALDVIDITGAPGATITLNVLYSDEGSANEYSYTLDDSGRTEHIVEFKDSRRITINGNSIRHPQDGLSYPQYNIAGKNAYMAVASTPGEVYYTVNGVTASDPIHTSEIVQSRYVRLNDDALVAMGIVQARIIYTSPRTGRVYDCAGYNASNRVVEFEDADVLRLAIPRTALTGSNQYVFGIESRSVYMAACFATPGEAMFAPIMYQVDTGTTMRRYYFSGYGGPLSSGGVDEKIVEFVLFDGTYKAVRGVGKGIGYDWCGRVLQFPRTMNGWQFVLQWKYPTNGLSAVPTSIPEEFVSLSGLYAFNTNINEATQLATAGWDVHRIVNFNEAFAYSNFNGPIEDWNVSGALNMLTMFLNNKVFNRDLSQWCVSNITDLPSGFADNADNFPLAKHPVWGTCPRGEI